MMRPLDQRGAAAAEMALVLPLMLIILMGPVELGNYFMNEHRLAKAVRDGARFAGRQPFGTYTCSSSSIDSTMVTKIKNVVRTGLLTGGNNLLPNASDAQIDVTLSCPANAAGVAMQGIYRGTTAIPVVKVSARVPYTPVLSGIGFNGSGYYLNADQQAAVMGL